jgi:hypothetical protein
MQRVVFIASWYVPGTHGRHNVVPFFTWYSPTLHAMQASVESTSP